MVFSKTENELVSTHGYSLNHISVTNIFYIFLNFIIIKDLEVPDASENCSVNKI